MALYLMSVHGTHTEESQPSPEEVQQMYADVDVFNRELQEPGNWVFAGGLYPPDTATVVTVRGRRDRPHRRPVRRDQGAARRVLGHRGRRPGRGPELAAPGQRGLPRAGRGPPVPGRRAPRRRTPVGRADRSRRTVDADAIGRVFRAESGRCVATLVRVFGDIDLAEEAVQEAFAVAVERWPPTGAAAQPRRLDHVTTARNRAIDRLRRESHAARAASAQAGCTLDDPDAGPSRTWRGGGTGGATTSCA